jgi:soluble lytic murein transglycosylase-like protein
MKRLIVPTCLFLSAWAHPAGPMFETSEKEPLTNVTVIEKKATPAAASIAAAAPPPAALTPASAPVAENTEQVLILSGDNDGDNKLSAADSDLNVANIDPNAADTDVAADTAEMPAEETANVETVRLPPRRAVPHHVVCEALASAAADYDLPTPFFIRLIWQESGFNQNAVSPAGAQGVAQFMPAVAQSMQLSDPFNPVAAVRTSAQLLRDLFKQFGNLGLAAAAYNAGPKRVQDWLDKHGKLPQETRDYVTRITGRAPEQWKSQKVTMHMHVPAHAPCQREAGLLAANGPAKIPMPPARQDGNDKIKDRDAQPQTRQLAAKAAKHRKHGDVRVASADPSQPLAEEPSAKAESAPAAKGSGKHPGKHQVKQAANQADKQADKHPAKDSGKHSAPQVARHSAKPAVKHGNGKPLQLAADHGDSKGKGKAQTKSDAKSPIVAKTKTKTAKQRTAELR